MLDGGKLDKGVHVMGDWRRRLGADLKRAYEKGATIRTLAEQYGRSYGFTHRLLTESGATMRNRGGYLSADKGLLSPHAIAGQNARRRASPVVEVMAILLKADRAMWATHICDRSSRSGTAVYAALGQAENNGWVTSDLRGRRARYYTLTDIGRQLAELVCHDI